MRQRTRLETLKLGWNPVMKAIIEALWRDRIPPMIIDFETDTPQIADYSIYEKMYGPYPDVKLYTIDALGNRIKRTEQPYFVMVDNRISSITFTAIVDGVLCPLVDGIQKGFITLKK